MKPTVHQRNTIQPGSRAVVIGGSVAGLSAAQVLVEYVEQVTIVDRDLLPEEPGFRSGVPQAHHAHILLPYGLQVLEHLFPGLKDQLRAANVPMVLGDQDTAYFGEGIWKKPDTSLARAVMSFSRPLFDGMLYRRLAENPRVRVLQGYDVSALQVDEQRERVTGVVVRSRHVPGNPPKILPANLVVDASGRNSRAPQWLSSLGFTPPEEWRINAYAGYASRIYRPPEDYPRRWKKLYVSPNPPDQMRGGVILPLEGNRWHVTLIGIAGDYPPTSEQEFLEYARSLPVPDLYQAIRSAEPLSKITGYRKNDNRVRRFDQLPRYLEGLLVLGDAAYTMNPVYALGMTAAAVSSQVLEKLLNTWPDRQNWTGFAEAYQKQLAHGITGLWQQAVRSEWRWPATEISDNTEELYPQAEGLTGTTID